MGNLEQCLKLEKLTSEHTDATYKFITTLQTAIKEYSEFLTRYNTEIDNIAKGI